MSLTKIFIIYKKEIKDTLRDRRTLMMMIMVPIVLYPLLFAAMGQIMMVGSKKLESEKSKIAYIPELPLALDSLIKADENLDVYVSPDPAADLKKQEIQAWFKYDTTAAKDSVFIYYDGAVDRSRQAQYRLKEVAEKYRRQVVERRLGEAGVTADELTPFGMREENTAPPSRMSGMVLGSIIPMLLIVTLLLGAMYPAIDLTAGEKERGTLETILTVPIQRSELLFGKFLTVTSIAVITGILNLASMIIAYSMGIIQLGYMQEGASELIFSPGTILIVLALIIPLALFLSAAILSVCIFARSFKDAQNFVTPLYLFLMFPALFASAPGIELNTTLAFIPILNVALVFKEILMGQVAFEMIFYVFLSNFTFAMLTILIFSRLFNAEEILFAEGKGLQFAFRRSEINPSSVFEPASALLLASVLLLGLFYLGSLVQLEYSHWGIFITEWGLLFLPIMIALWYNKIDFKEALNLRGFHPMALVGTVLLAIGSLGLVAWIGYLQTKVFPEAAKISEALEKILNMDDTGINPWIGLLIFSISPAICEELLFRGAILSSFKKKFPPAITIIAVAALFGIFHVHLFRLLPTALIGVYLTFIVYKTGSIYLSIIAHALNNGFAVLLISYPQFAEKFAWLFGVDSPPSPAMLLGMACLVVIGVFIISKTSPKQNLLS